MKKTSVLLMLLAFLLAFTGCYSQPLFSLSAEEDSLSGKYVLKEVVTGEQTLPVDFLRKVADSPTAAILDTSFTFSGQQVTVNILDQSFEGVYQIDGDKLIITDSTGSQEYAITDGQIMIKQDNMTLVFAK